MFQTGFPPIIRSSKLHIQRQAFVRPLLLPAASLARLAAGSSIGVTLYVQFWAPDDGRKNFLKHVQRLTEINKLWNIASCWLYSANLLAMHGPMNVKFQTLLSVQGKGKAKVHHRTDHDGLQGREVYLYSFFNLDTIWGGPLALRPGRFTPGKWPVTHCTGGWVGPRTGLEGCEKSRAHRDSTPGPSSP